MTFIRNGWPFSYSQCSPDVKPYYHIKEELSIVDGVVLKDKVLVPSINVPHGKMKSICFIHQKRFEKLCFIVV